MILDDFACMQASDLDTVLSRAGVTSIKIRRENQIWLATTNRAPCVSSGGKTAIEALRNALDFAGAFEVADGTCD